MADESKPFARSGQTARTPPQQSNRSTNVPSIAHESNNVDPKNMSCVLCLDFDTVDMAECNRCLKMLHFKCAGVVPDTVTKQFVCQNCMPNTSKAKSSKSGSSERSHKSKSSSASRSSRSDARKRKLALERIEEERRLQEAVNKQYLDKKYATLEDISDSSSDSEAEKVDNTTTRDNTLAYTSQWVENQLERVNISNPVVSVSSAQSQVKQLTLVNTASVTESVATQNLQPSTDFTNRINPKVLAGDVVSYDQVSSSQQTPISSNGQVARIDDTHKVLVGFSSHVVTLNQPVVYQQTNPVVSINASDLNIRIPSHPLAASSCGQTLNRPSDLASNISKTEINSSRNENTQPTFSSLDQTSDVSIQSTAPYRSTNGHLGEMRAWMSNYNAQRRNKVETIDCSRQAGGFINTTGEPPTPWELDPIFTVPCRQNIVNFATPLTTAIQSNPMMFPPGNNSNNSMIVSSIADITSLQNNAVDMGQPNSTVTTGLIPPNIVNTGNEANLVESSFYNPSSTYYSPISSNVMSNYMQCPSSYAVSSRVQQSAAVATSLQGKGTNPLWWSARTSSQTQTGYNPSISTSSYAKVSAPQAVRLSRQYEVIPMMPPTSFEFTGTNQPVPQTSQPTSHQFAIENYLMSGYRMPSSYNSSILAGRGSIPSSTTAPETTQVSDFHRYSDSRPFHGNPTPETTRLNAFRGYTDFGRTDDRFDHCITIPTTNRFGENISTPNDILPQAIGSTSFTSDIGRTLTPNQIAARQVVPKKLPEFYGEIEKFPAFLRAYENSTQMCGFTHGENLSRLADSLKGVAYDYVEQQLLYPDDVPRVIESLKMMFGNPEFVIDKLMAKIAKQPSPQADDLSSIVKFSMGVQNICGTIKSSGLHEQLRNPTLMKSLVDKLPPTQQLMWACHKQSVPNANLETLGAWLYELAKLASSISGPPKVKREQNPEKTNRYVNAQVEGSSKQTNTDSKSQTKKRCPACNQSSCDRLKECKTFVSLDLKGRWAIVKDKELCLRCLGNHRFKSCRSKQQCNIGACQRAHNPMLHDNDQQFSSTNSNAKVNSDSVKVSCSHQSTGRKVDIFRIAPVVLHHNGKSISTFAYLDDGSNITMIESNLADELELDNSAEDTLCVKWSFGKMRREELVSRRVSVQISGVYSNAAKYELHNVRTVDDLALPSQTISQEWLNSYTHFENIPITPYENAKPRMLIGLQYSKLMVSRRTIERKWSEPIACKTRLGWIVQGPDSDRQMESNVVTNYSMNICECHRDDSELHTMVKEFFSWDNLGTKIPETILESKENQRARKILESTTRKVDGRYETGLLWRYDDVEFPETYQMALKRLECLERKMEKDPVLATKMCIYIQDFLEKGYIRKLTPDELRQEKSRVCYLPIFPVFNPKKPEKFRVVWDAAALVKKVSLNSMLLAGPDQLNPLPDVIRRFREGPIGITGDMKEMFHQVKVIEPDIHAQRFLWRDGNSKRKPDVYVIDVLTFGGKNSPSSAQFVKNKNAMEFKDRFPEAVDAIVKNHYQDDLLDSTQTVDEAVQLTKDVKFIHLQAGFEMRNFKSNSTKVLEKLGEKLENHQKNLNISTELATERVLGMFWNTSTDNFTFSLKFVKLSEEMFKGQHRPTKREVLKAIMSIFDPLGLIAQYLVHGKILLQEIWRNGTDWDQKISDSTYKLWTEWLQLLPKIEQIEIPRWYSTKLSSMEKTIQIHIFVDAGVEACAAAVYYRIEDREGVDCCLVGAKTKVAPNKPLSVPRLELQSAVLGLRLVQNIEQSQRIKAVQRFFWSDSQTVLGWINSEARKYHQYVAFRIGEILEGSSSSEWRWVDTKNNVADDATKWKINQDISSSSRWYKSPSFLYQPQETWDIQCDEEKFIIEEEMRSVYLLAHIEVPNNNIVNAKEFSNWNRLKRAVAYALRFIDNSKRQKRDRQAGPITRFEYVRALNVLYRQAQREDFMEETIIIRNNESLPIGERREFHKSSALRACSPYLDENGLLRIRGRIDAARSVSYNTKRPIILPRNNYITKLVVYSYHQKYHHMNHQTTLNEINQMFYIPALRVVLKNVIENLCQRCKNDRAKPAIPEMAELPPARLSTFTRPYTYVGIDYFGPMKVKVRRFTEKRWGVIFTCLTTRAVYIDLAASLDTSSCICCIRNFSNRNGPPLEYYSDNGANIAAAEKELREEFQKMNRAKVEEYFTNEHTQWHFNPPTGAHMGGAWERLIHSFKSILNKSMPTRLPTEEMLRSYLIEAENIINSRPLTYVQLDHIDDEVLTPNHFLRGSSSGTKCPGRFNPKHLLRDDWKAVQEMTNKFWQRFVVEYLPTLTRRTKWFKDVKPIEIGDLVVIIDEDSERNTWRKGIVEEVFFAKGNKVRRALVRLIRGDKANLTNKDITDIRHQTLIRPVAKLAVLDIAEPMVNSSSGSIYEEGNVVNAPATGQMYNYENIQSISNDTTKIKKKKKGKNN